MSETGLDTRLERRLRLAFRAVVTDRQSLVAVSCLIRDGSASGCRLVSSQIDVLPKQILIRMKGLSEPIPGRIAWRTKKMAGVGFEWENLGGPDSRRARRHDTSLRVTVTTPSGEAFDGMILDASVSGARLYSVDVDRIPDTVLIAVKGIAAPIPGRIVWRRDNEAGVALTFPEMKTGYRGSVKPLHSTPEDAEDIMDLASDCIVKLES